MTTSNLLRNNVKKICEKALTGELSFDDFHNSWPREARNTPFWDKIFRDAENVMEHLPEGAERENLEMYARLYLDIKLLNSDAPDEELLIIKEKIQKEIKPLLADKIDNALEDLLKNNRRL